MPDPLFRAWVLVAVVVWRLSFWLALAGCTWLVIYRRGRE